MSNKNEIAFPSALLPCLKPLGALHVSHTTLPLVPAASRQGTDTLS